MKTEKKCKGCGQTKLIDQFYLNRQGTTGPIYFARCKACTNRKTLDRWHTLTIEQKRVIKEKANITFPPEWHKDYRLRTKYGISLDIFNKMYQEQKGLCRICDTPTPENTIRVDHCHSTGKVRGLLCHPCNASLGLLKEDIHRLHKCIEYLTE